MDCFHQQSISKFGFCVNTLLFEKFVLLRVRLRVIDTMLHFSLVEDNVKLLISRCRECSSAFCYKFGCFCWSWSDQDFNLLINWLVERHAHGSYIDFSLSAMVTSLNTKNNWYPHTPSALFTPFSPYHTQFYAIKNFSLIIIIPHYSFHIHAVIGTQTLPLPFFF